jgi:hypothetical protein
MRVQVSACADRDCVLLEAATATGQRIAAMLRLSGLPPGDATVGIEADGTATVNPANPVWATVVHIPPSWAGVDASVVPALAGH